ncbi:hypothetical protein GCM10009790_34800 [Georgenia ruanii]
MRVRRSTETRTSGGSSDTERNELAVMPRTSPWGEVAVMTITPLAKRPSAVRNSLGSTVEVATVIGTSVIWTFVQSGTG